MYVDTFTVVCLSFEMFFNVRGFFSVVLYAMAIMDFSNYDF